MQVGPIRRAARSTERGFELYDVVVGTALVAGAILATASALGTRPPRLHGAALALQSAVAEARGLARVTGSGAPGGPGGATILVAGDPLVAGGSVLSVYRSRPIAAVATVAGEAGRLSADTGFPPLRVAASFRVHDGAAAIEPPFAILISNAGYVDLVPGYRAGDPPATASAGCDEAAGVTIDAIAGERTETHALLCREATYDASASAGS